METITGTVIETTTTIDQQDMYYITDAAQLLLERMELPADFATNEEVRWQVLNKVLNQVLAIVDPGNNRVGQDLREKAALAFERAVESWLDL